MMMDIVASAAKSQEQIKVVRAKSELAIIQLLFFISF